jgi:LPS-assembly lipoprotein
MPDGAGSGPPDKPGDDGWGRDDARRGDVDPTTTRRTALLLGLGGALSGCGFHPVYAPSGDGPGPAAQLTEVEIKPIYERPGQILRQALLGRFRSESGQPRKFDLAVNFWITGEAQGVLDFTQPTRMRLVGATTWTLTSRDAKSTKLTEGHERVVDGFDIFDSQYFAQDLANEAVQRRMAEAMAERITIHLAVWFNEHPKAA